jgi:hypothetical protein
MARQIFCVGSTSTSALQNPGSGATAFFVPVQTWLCDTTEADIEAPWMVAGTFRNLIVTTPTDPGGTARWDFTLRLNNSNTALTAAIVAGTTTGRDIANDVAVAVGDVLTMQCVPTNTPNVAGTTGEWQLSIEFEGDNPAESGYSGCAQPLNSTTTLRNGVFAPYGWNATAALVQNVVAAAGSLTAARIRLTGSPGAGNSYVFNLYKNGVKQDGTGGTVDTTITIADAATSGDWSGTLTLAAGDTVYWECVPNSSPTLRSAAMGVRFLATTDGQANFCGVNTSTINATNNTYSSIMSRDDDWDTSEGSNEMRGGVTSFGLSGLRVLLNGDPSPGSYNFSVRRNTSSPAGTPSATVTAGNTSASDLTNAITIADGDLFTIRADPDSSPTARQAAWAFIQTDPGVAPPTANDDAYSTPFETLLTIGAGSGVLANDTQNGGGGSLTAVLDTDVSNGELTLNSDGSFTYQPDEDFTGTDTFTYHAVDSGGSSSSATVTITVAASVPVDERPIGIVELGLGGSPQARMRELSPTRLWLLGDVRNTRARDDMHSDLEADVSPSPHGTYVGSPVNGRGMWPWYGLSMSFDGATQYVNVDSGLIGTTAPFTIVAFIRPAAGSPNTDQCILQTGTNAAYLGRNTANQVVFGRLSGTLLTSTLVLVDGDSYLVVGTYDGTDARLYVVSIEEADETVDVTGPTAVSFTASHDSTQARIGATVTPANFFDGEIQGVATFALQTLDAGDVDTLHESALWTDVSEDVQFPIVWDRGIHSDRPDTRWARTGTMTVILDNSERNTPGLLGYYTPEHYNAREGFDRGIPCRFVQEVGSDHLVKFIGTIKTIQITPGEFLQREVPIVVTDWFDEAAKATITGIAIQQNVTGDDVFARLIDNMDQRPHAIDLGEGSDVYPVALHNSQDERSTVQSEGIRIVNTEQGYGYVKGDGTFVFEPRSVRRSAINVDYALEKIRDAAVDRSGTAVYNRVLATVHPSRVDADATTVLYSNFNDLVSPPTVQPLAIDHGADLSIFLPFRDPAEQAIRVGAINFQEPVANVDLFLNSAEDFTGTDLTGDPTVTYSFVDGGNGVYFNILNEWGQRIWAAVRIIGQGVYDYDAVTVRSEDRDSIRREGLQELRIDLPYLASPSVAQGLANYIRLASIDQPTRLRTVQFRPTGHVELVELFAASDISTRLGITEDMGAIDNVFVVNGERVTWNKGDAVDVTYWLDTTLAGSSEGGGGGTGFWVLGTSVLGTSTRLAA